MNKNIFKRGIKLVWRSSPQDWIQRITGKNSATPNAALRRVWCLSTGRVGTQTLATLAALDSNVFSLHEPLPKLFGLSRCAYEDNEFKCKMVFEEALRTCRSAGLMKGRSVYFESSPQLTFLAPILQSVYKNSIFIHVVRHPAEVVRSGMRRKWYDGNPNDRWRIEPVTGYVADRWENMSCLEKNIWLWAETNKWIDEFIAGLPDGMGIRLKSEDIFNGNSESIERFYSMIGVELPSKRSIQRVLGRKMNMQVTGKFPELDAWSISERELLESYCGKLMRKYGYSL